MTQKEAAYTPARAANQLKPPNAHLSESTFVPGIAFNPIR